MKTKLLKIVRNRYVIDRIDSVRRGVNTDWVEICTRYGFPCYYIQDVENEFNNRMFKSYDEAYSYLKIRILREYSFLSTHGVSSETTVWPPKTKKQIKK